MSDTPTTPPTPPEEAGFHAAIKAAPDDLTAHLAYADFLAEQGHESRAKVLRAWVALSRITVTEDALQTAIDAHAAYQGSLLQKDADWIEAMDALRRWISKPIAETIVRTFIDDVFGPTPAVTWKVDVTRGIFDDRWSGKYEGELEKDGKTTTRKGTFFVNQIIGSGSGHVFSV